MGKGKTFQNFHRVDSGLLYILYSLTELRPEPKNLLSWRTTEGKTRITNNRSSIFDEGREKTMLSTAQKLQISLQNFSFEIEVIMQTAHTERYQMVGISILL